MKKFFKIFPLLFLFFISGCENIDVITPTVSYSEKIVVRGELKAYSFVQGVSFTKTLPLNETYSIEKAELKNVTAYLLVNGTRVITLKYSNSGIYLPLDTIRISPGETYELFADVNETSIYAKTIIPQLPVITSAELKGDRYMEITVLPNEDEVYGAAWEIYNSSTGFLIDQATDFQTILLPDKNDFETGIVLTTKDLPEKYISSSFNNYKFATVYAFDKQYLKFFKTKNNNQPTENVFAQGGDQIGWNVQGKNVIGLFIGLANTSHIHLKK